MLKLARSMAKVMIMLKNLRLSPNSVQNVHNFRPKKQYFEEPTHEMKEKPMKQANKSTELCGYKQGSKKSWWLFQNEIIVMINLKV